MNFLAKPQLALDGISKKSLVLIMNLKTKNILSINESSLLIKLTCLLAILCFSSSCLQAQYIYRDVVVTTKQASKFVGQVLAEDDTYLLLSLKTIKDTIAIDRAIIENIFVKEDSNEIKKQDEGVESKSYIDSLLVFFTRDDSKFIGYVLAESDSDIVLDLKGINDTITLNKEVIKKIERPRSQRRYKSKKKRKAKVKTIKYENGSVFKGYFISEDDNQITIELLSYGDTISLSKNHIIDNIDKNNAFLYRWGRYHKKEGFVRVLSFHYNYIDNYNYHDMFDPSYERERSSVSLVQFMLYKLVKPKLAIGGGVGYATITELTYRDAFFIDLYLYGKYYINNGFGRLFLDTKLGAAIPIRGDEFNSFSFGPKLQPGIGIEFARKSKSRFYFSVNQLIQYSNIKKRVNFVDADFTTKKLYNRTLFGVSMMKYI